MSDPPAAPVFWLPQQDTSVVVLADAPALLTANADTQLNVESAIARDAPEGVYLFHDLGNGQHVQALLHGVNAGSTLAALVPLGVDGFDRLESIYRLLAALHGRTVPADTRLTRQQRARARRMLQAYDGNLDGATQQEIAQVIFRIKHLSRDEWQASSSRHAVKSLLRDARGMIAGGYRQLLRHRRATAPSGSVRLVGEFNSP